MKAMNSPLPLTLCVTTDIHGTISATAYHDQKVKPFGLSRYATALTKLRQTKELLIIDNGDSLQGSPLLTLSHQLAQRPVILAQVFNQLKVNYHNLGNHDFNYGIERLLHTIEDMDAPCLTSNVLYRGKALGSSRIHITNSGLRLGLIGVCTDYVPHWERPENIENVTFLDPVLSVDIEVQRLRTQVDQIIVCYHGGLERDLQSLEPTEHLTGENVGIQIAQLDGIDVLITGHQHRSLIGKLGKTLITQSTLNAQEFVQIEIDVKRMNTAQLVNLRDFEIDESVEMLIDPLQKRTHVWLDQSLGTLDQDLLITDAFEARLHKHPLVSFINQVQLDYSKADMSATALFNHPIGLKQTVTLRDLVSTYIYPNSLVVKEMTGSQLKAYLEQTSIYFALKDNKIIVNPLFDEPKPQHFNYDMLDGIEYGFKISNPIGQRLTHCRFKGQEIQDQDIFSVVMNNYRAVGGGNYAMIPECKNLREYTEDVVDIISAYFKQHPYVSVSHQDNITIIP